MKRSAPLLATLALALTAALAYASTAQKAEPRPKPLLLVGSRYVFLSPGEVKRSADVVEDLGGGWYKMRYKHSDGVVRMIWMNLNQVLYFQPEEPAGAI